MLLHNCIVTYCHYILAVTWVTVRIVENIWISCCSHLTNYKLNATLMEMYQLASCQLHWHPGNSREPTYKGTFIIYDFGGGRIDPDGW